MTKTKLRMAMTGGLLVIGMLLAGCVADPGDGPAASAPSETTETGQESPHATPSSGPAVTARALFGGRSVEVTAAPVETRGGIALLRLGFREADGAELPPLSLILRGADDEAYENGAFGLRLFDTEAKTVLPVLADGNGARLSTPGSDLRGGHTEVTTLSAHAAPEGDTIDVLIPSLGWLRDVPVVEAGESFDADLGSLGGTPKATPGIALREYTEAYDEATAVKSEGERVTVTLASDVLFATGQSSLSAEAAKKIDAAAADIADSADGGEVQVIGHTDDVDTTESNQVLSEDRAKAVAERLAAALGGDFTVVPSGKGETEPIAEDATPEARAANRRVEVGFTGYQDRESDKAEASIPDTTDPVIEAGGSAEPAVGDNKYSLSVSSVVREGATLVGTFDLGLVEGQGTPFTAMGAFDRPGAIRRGFGQSAAYVSTLNVALLTAQGRLFPYDYEMPDGDGGVTRRTLGDEWLNAGVNEPGQKMSVTVVWPDTGQDTITIEVPGRARFVDVPVTDG